MNTLADSLGVKNGSMYAKNEQDGSYGRIFQYGKSHSSHSKIAKNNQLVRYAEGADDVFSKYDASEETVKQLDELEATVVVAIKHAGVTLGIVFLGEKSSGDRYSLEDFELLKVIAGQTGIALQNVFYVNELKNKTNELERLLNHERELDKLKNEFISIASHNLRTPLTTIEGYVAFLQKDKSNLSEHNQKALSNLSYAVIKLNQITERLLTISSLDRGEIVLSKTKFSLMDLINRIVSDYQDYANNQGDRLIVHPPQLVMPDVYADRLKIILVVENLIENAIKFTHAGTIEVTAENKNGLILVTVSDSGEGIPESEKDNIFSKFYQAGKTMYAVPGIGTGLYMCKEIITAHGGEIWFESKEGSGSRFTFSLPINDLRGEKS
jgi:signal transduction histidine kinase